LQAWVLRDSFSTDFIRGYSNLSPLGLQRINHATFDRTGLHAFLVGDNTKGEMINLECQATGLIPFLLLLSFPEEIRSTTL
jgi:hypothetical protein